MKFVEDWKECWKWFSVHIAAIIGTIGAIQATLPAFQLSPATMGLVNTGLSVALIWARLIQQQSNA